MKVRFHTPFLPYPSIFSSLYVSIEHCAATLTNELDAACKIATSDRLVAHPHTCMFSRPKPKTQNPWIVPFYKNARATLNYMRTSVRYPDESLASWRSTACQYLRQSKAKLVTLAKYYRLFNEPLPSGCMQVSVLICQVSGEIPGPISYACISSCSS